MASRVARTATTNALKMAKSSIQSQKRLSFSKPFTTRLYSKTHEWIITDGRSGIVGITNHARDGLGDVVFVETPEVGSKLNPEEHVAGCLESTKAAHDINCPVFGKVTEVNEELLNNPSLVNHDPLNRGWLYKLQMDSAAGTSQLMDAAAYEVFLRESAI